MIDEQLRKVGWDAFTENLRYFKGTRPQNGRNIQTDGGIIDYALFVGMKIIATI